MRVPIGWLAEYVDLPAGTTVEDLDTAFVRLGLEVEEIHRAEQVTGPLVVGRVLEIEELTGFKKPIRYCQVDVGEDAAAGHRLRRPQLRRRRHRRRRAARRRAARRLRDRRPEDLRPRLRRDDLLGPRARHRRRPRRHPGARSADGGAARRRRRARPPARSSASTTSSSSWRSPPTAATACRCAASPASWAPAWPSPWRDPGAATPPAWSGEPAWQVTVADPDRCDRFSMLAMEGLDPTAPSPWWMRRRLAQAGDPQHLAGRRHHQLRDARARPADARLRPRRRHRADHRPAGAARGRSSPPWTASTRTLAADDLVITDDTGPIGLAARDGRRVHRDRRRHDRRAAGGGALGAHRRRPHRPPAQAAQRGGEALRARRRPGDDRGRAGPRGRAARRVRRRHGRRRARRRRHPGARGRRSRSTPRCPARVAGVRLHRRPRSSSCSTRSAATSTPTATRSRSPRRPGGPTSPTRPTWSRRSSGWPATTTSRRCCRPRRPAAG